MRAFPITLTLLVAAVAAILATGCSRSGEESIEAFCGSAAKPALEECAKAFRERTETRVNLHFGGSGTMLSMLKLSNQGDVYVPGSPDYMIRARQDGIVGPDMCRILAYLAPAILVPHGNPKDIHELSDLARDGVTVGIGNPQAVCVGLYAVELLEYNGLLDKVRKNIVVEARSCADTASLVATGKVDAVLGWHVFSEWNPGRIGLVMLKPDQIPRLAYVPAAVTNSTTDEQRAESFVEFLHSPRGREAFSDWGYIASEKKAREFAPEAEIGGTYTLADPWTPDNN